MTPELRTHYGAPRDAGVLVAAVETDSAASKAGIQVGDIITAVDGERIDSTWELSRAIRRKKVGETVKVEVYRDRASKHLSVSVEERKKPEIRLGDIGNGSRGHRWVIRDLDAKRAVPEPLESFGRLRDRIDEIEKRLRDLEKKLPAR